MIAFDFAYYQPATLEKAIQLYQKAVSMNKKAMYYSGGTEFITFARKGNVHADVIIDIKAIPECNLLEVSDGVLIIGAAVSLNDLANANIYPLLGEIARQIADHTSRNKITIGGNLNSKLIYKETILPLLLTDAKVEIYGSQGSRSVLLKETFKEYLQLSDEDLLTQIKIPIENISMPYSFVKRTRMSKIGYPVVSIATIIKDEQLQIAMSGVCPYPFRSEKLEEILNETNGTCDERIEKALKELPTKIVDDANGSASYRRFLIKQILKEMYEVLGREK